MNGTAWSWNGARWWKFDVHTHTPASSDYGKGPNKDALGKRSPKDWLLDYMRAGIDCVAITDHNSGAWIDQLWKALGELDTEQPAGYRPIHLFAGAEISVNGGVHLLAILASDKTTSDIDSLLGAVGYSGTKGSSDSVTSRSFAEVVGEIVRVGGIALPAHIDCANGLFQLQGTTLQQVLDLDEIFATEIVDPACSKPHLYTASKRTWTEVLGSDAHHPQGNAGQQYPGSHFTWVKMGTPSIEGLRLALLDGSLSVLRSDQVSDDPNAHAPFVLESVEVSQARYMGRAEPFTLQFNPWLNAIVGGRGTGKSTIVEFLRLALRREAELTDELKPEFEKYSQVYASRDEGGLLTDQAEIRVVYRKEGTRFRVQWSPTGALDPIQEDSEGTWRRSEGEVAQRFPIRLYSQKQVFHLARTPLALLRIVDEAPEVGRRSWNDRRKEEEGRFLSLRAKARELEAGLAEEARLKGELDDVKRKLAIFEEAGHAEVLKAFQKRTRQTRAVEAWEQSWADTGRRLRKLAGDIVPDSLVAESFDSEAEEDQQIRAHAESVRTQLQGLHDALGDLGGKADAIAAGWKETLDASSWRQRATAALEAYQALQSRLAEEGAGDPAAYGELVQRRQNLERRLEDVDARRRQAEELRRQAQASSQRLTEIRRELTASRTSFLAKVLHDNRYVRIKVVPYGARESTEPQLRQLLQRETGGFERDIGTPEGGGLLGAVYGRGSRPEDIETALAEVKERLSQIAAGAHDPANIGDQRFAKHVARLQPEAFDRIDLWFPEDSLEVEYSSSGDGQRFRSIQEGSPGQKTAALLAFLLSYGEEPLVLDQPEDDLDNHLIYDLIVTQLREVKRRRQIIVVTHNPNIVVNGDAELVAALVARAGQTHKECEGSLQEKSVRDTICTVMEGGREAFEQRYRRIALEGRRA